MNVYIVIKSIRYEGEEIKGVYSKSEDAEERRRKEQEEEKMPWGDYVTYYVSEWDVQ